FRDLPDPRQTGKALYPLEEVVLLSRLRGSAFAEIPPLEGSKCNKNVAKVLAENAQVLAENRLTEREGVLLRGSAEMRGFAGCLDHSLDLLERCSPGVGARFRGHTRKRWRRNTAAMRAWPRCRQCAPEQREWERRGRPESKIAKYQAKREAQ